MARDAYNILSISKGHLTLIGPKHNFGGFYAGPYFYYLFVPIFVTFGMNFDYILFFNALIFATAVGYLSLKVYEKYNLLNAVLAALIFSLSSGYIEASRNVGNGYTFLPFLLIFLTYVYSNKEFSAKKLFVLGLFSGFILNIHPIALFAILPAVFYIFINLKLKLRIFFIPLGVLLTFVPVILFEVKHNFVMIRKTLDDVFSSVLIRQQTFFPNNTFFKNFMFSADKLGQLLDLNPLVYFLVFLATFLIFKKIRSNVKVLTLAAGSFFMLILYIFLSRGVYEMHYLLPFLILILFTFLMIISETKLVFLGLLIIFVEILGFNFKIYKNSNKTSLKYEEAVNYIIANKLIDKNSSFNVIEVTDVSNLVPSGYGYRYFFLKKGFEPKSVNDYQNSHTLYVFSDVGDLNIEGLRNWETSQFGLNYLNYARKLTWEKGEIFIVSKTN